MIAYSCHPLALERHLLLSRLFALHSSVYLRSYATIYIYTSRANFLLVGKLLINNKKNSINNKYMYGQIDQLLVFWFLEEITCRSQ